MDPYIFPDIDPIAIQIGPLAIRWYALAYIAGLIGGWRFCLMLAKREPNPLSPRHIDDFLVWATIGVVLGGRLGFVMFYRPAHYLANPLDILQVWQGGMSFHGGLLGVILAMALFARSRKIPLFALADVVAAAAPIGLFFGRIANFINGELWGRVTDAPWAFVFPRAGPDPRHPSQLYEAALEGLVVFAILALLVYRFDALRRPRLVSGAFLIGYGVSRILVETVREPDDYIGLLSFGTTWGQWLSAPMALYGLYLVRDALQRPAPSANEK